MRVMICLLARRRLGAYLDGALDSGPSGAVVRHLDRCSRCHLEADRLRRMTVLIRLAVPRAPEPDWTGFWPGIVRGVQDDAMRRLPAGQRRWSRRWILGGATAAGVAALSLVAAYQHFAPSAPEEVAVVTEADTQYPGGAMVYHAPEKVAVVWVFDE